MNNFNQAIVPKIIDYVKRMISRIEASSHEGAKIQLEKYESDDSNNLDISYLISHEMTGTFILKLYFKITNGKESVTYDEDLEIPKLINNVFIVEGAPKIPTSTLDNDDSITVYTSNIRINESLNIIFEEDPHEPDGLKLTVNIYEDEDPLTIDGSVENFEKYKRYFSLSTAEIDKLKVKLDTDDIGQYLTRDIVVRLAKRGSDKNYDNLIDKKIYSPESNFMKYLWSRDVRSRVLRSMKQKFFQYNRVYLKDIQRQIEIYFKTASEKNIDIPTTINPFVYDALKYKIRIPENVAYNQSMADIIDVASTPINQNVNGINELNVCAEIIDDVIHIKCYEYPSQKPVKIPYTTYCTKRVVVNDVWDYDKKQFKDGVNEVSYKLRMKYLVGSKTDQYDLIEPKPDDKLSITTRRIPFGNRSDSVRISMSTSFQKQAVELGENETPLVGTGHDDTDTELSTLLTRCTGIKNGVVDKIIKNKIYVKNLDDDSVQFFEVPPPTPGMNDSVTSYIPMVKVGDKVTEGTVIIGPTVLKHKSYDLGINSNAIYMNYLGYTHEDAIVISESYAKRLTHYNIINVALELYPDDIIKFIRKVGSKITAKDVLVNNKTRLRVSSANKNTFTGEGGLLRGMGISYNSNKLLVPNNIDIGYVVDVKIHFENGRTLTSEESLKVIEAYQSEAKSNDYDSLPDKFKLLKADDVLLSQRAAGYISMKIVRVNACKVGDKLCNRYGSKGIVSLILPDECMPQIEDSKGNRTPSEILLNPAGVLSRQNISQIYEVALTKCIEAIFTRVTEYVKSNDIDGVKEFLRRFYKNKFDSLSNQEFYELYNSRGIFMFKMDIGFFSDIKFETIKEWMDYLGVKDVDTIYCPDVVICETKDGIKGYPMKGYMRSEGETPKFHELGYCDGELVTGKEYMYKLYHSGDYSGKVTSTNMTGSEPIMGRGHYRADGQKIGEMELWIMLESGTERFVQEQSPDMVKSQYVFLNQLLQAGYTITKDGDPMLSRSKGTLDELKALDKK